MKERHMKLRVVGIMALGLAALAGPARAQVVWDAPVLLTPRPATGTGLYLHDAHRAGLGILGTWRGAPHGLGLRLGIVDGRRDGVGILGGVDMMAPLTTASAQFPLDISWFTGIGGGYDDWFVLSVPLGLSIGRTFGAPGAAFTPHIIPRVVADAHLGRDGPGDSSELRLELGVDLGLDLALQPGWLIRFGAGLGNRGGLAVGVVF
jgi:hypothetical protein